MKKQELLHMHALLVEVADHVTPTGSATDIAAYQAAPVRPTSLHRPKADHEDAVMTLAHAITDEIGPETSPEVARATPSD